MSKIPQILGYTRRIFLYMENARIMSSFFSHLYLLFTQELYTTEEFISICINAKGET